MADRLIVNEIVTESRSETKEYAIVTETAARIYYELNGHFFLESCEINDFYGVGTSIKTAIEEAIEKTGFYGITKDCIVAIKVDKIVRVWKKINSADLWHASGTLQSEEKQTVWQRGGGVWTEDLT